MQLTSTLSLLLAGAVAGASAGCTNFTSGPDRNGKYWIHGDGIKAAFIPYGASISDLVINDRYGIPRDIIMGFDNATYYSIDESHPHLGGVPGRYANRIRNSSFVIDGETFNVDANDNDGANTLHGGSDGWDYRNFTVVTHTRSSITFSIVDEDGRMGFPGEVVSNITYTLNGMDWDFKMVALATTRKTPIMLSSHAYWNLDGFANNETSLALNHTFHMPYGGLRVGVDNILIPTGELLPNVNGSVNDFWSEPKQIGASWEDPELVNNCGLGCTGYGMFALPIVGDERHVNGDVMLTIFLARQLLPCQPRAARRLRLAHDGPRGVALVGVVRHPGRRLVGPGRLPDVQLQLPRRQLRAQAVPGTLRRARLPARGATVRLRCARGAGLDRRHQPPRVVQGFEADLWTG